MASRRMFVVNNERWRDLSAQTPNTRQNKENKASGVINKIIVNIREELRRIELTGTRTRTLEVVNLLKSQCDHCRSFNPFVCFQGDLITGMEVTI